MPVDTGLAESQSQQLLYLYIYIGLVFCLALQRLAELVRSKRGENALKAQGGREVAARHFIAMRLVHTLWLVACVAEAVWRQTPPAFALSAAALCVLGLGQVLRRAAMSALGPRWTVRIITLPHAIPITHGIYRYVRHPNYLGVILEIAALPLIYGSWLTAIGFSVANAAVLWVRIGAEEAALEAVGGYARAFRHTRRFFPSRRSSTESSDAHT